MRATGPTPEAYRLDGCVTDVSAVLDAEDLDRAVVWGYSRGAFLAEAFARQHPERCSAVILGGTVVGLSASDRTNISHPEMDAVLRSGDWGRYFDEVFPFLDAETRELFERRNDPIAAAAVSEAFPYPHAGDGAPLPEATLTYAGRKEPWFEVAAAVAQSLDVDFAAVPDADHAEAFRAAETVVSLARNYLDVPAA